MRNKRLLRTLSALCLTLVLASGFTVPAFAQGAAPPPAEDTTNDSNVVVEETEKAPPLTPEGNAALVDDFGGNKQLITVTTKAGNYFYILIDRANEDKKTAVHFLNQVDEADLMALMEDGNAKEEPPAVCSCTKKCEAGAVNTTCPVCVCLLYTSYLCSPGFSLSKRPCMKSLPLPQFCGGGGKEVDTVWISYLKP